MSTDGHLDCFHVSATVNNALVNTGVSLSFQMSVSAFFGKITRSDLAEAGLGGVGNVRRSNAKVGSQ